ncbi:Ig-like domain-containing protein [Paenibacillus gansuensis]|uniref:Ig-like domain-containing protein n=1 Tax=Paenibacillus gansuensis TaxID=306542 RepID=A0ABW5PMV0_9BACL
MISAKTIQSIKKAAIGSAFLITFAAAAFLGAPTASAYKPLPLESSQYPENNATGVPSQLEFVRLSFNSNPGRIVGTHSPTSISISKADQPGGREGQQAKIQVIELSTNTPVHATLSGTDVNDDGVADPELHIQGNTLAIKVNPFDSTKAVDDPFNKNRLKPGETYQVIIPQGSVVHKAPADTSFDNNDAITWTFTVERKPTPSVFSFQPGNQTFRFDPKVTNTGLPNNVSALGVGYRKTLVLEFQNGVKPNIPENTVVISGNELSSNATPHNPNTVTKQDPKASNTLIVTMDTNNPLKANHLYTVNISNNITDADSNTLRYFNKKPITPSSAAVKVTASKSTAQYKSDVIAYAEQVRRYAFNAIYPYFMKDKTITLNAATEAEKLANLATNTLRNVTMDTTTTTAAALETAHAKPLYDAIETATTGFDAVVIASYSYDNETGFTPESKAMSNKYPLTNDPISIRFSTFRDFKETLINPATATVQNINNTILSIEPPRRVGVVVPKSYIKNIETLHYVQGLVPSTQGNNLTNIDITADSDVDKIIINSNRGPRILTSKVNNVFTAGYSGLEADGINEIRIQAYDKYGQILEERNIKLSVQGNNPLKNDYLPKESKALGKTYTLYELMEDPKLFSEVLLHFPVSKLNELGIFLPYTP